MNEFQPSRLAAALWLAMLAAACAPDDSTQLTLEICDNELDDDSNGAIDCDDPRCTSAENCLQAADCGNGVREGLEFCDGADVGEATCETQGFLDGTLGCRADCAGFSTLRCVRADRCGNELREGGEECDGADLDDASCLSRGFAEGTLACSATCQFDESSCSGVNPCGNGAIDDGEVCDGDVLNSTTCADLGFRGDGLACAGDCSAFDVNGCEIELCGNGRLDPGELCDGGALRDDASCESEGFASGSLGCNSTCDEYVTEACSQCGNGVIDEGEVCDGGALGGRSCVLEGFVNGELRCNADCSALDTSLCTNCGNDTIDEGEVCDGDPEPEVGCGDVGYRDGTLGCLADCSAYDTAGCGGFSECGNGALDGLDDQRAYQEFCDPTVAYFVDPFFLTVQPLAEGCLIYDVNGIEPTPAGNIVCTSECRLDISNCAGVGTADFCATVGWYTLEDGVPVAGDGVCDPCDRISGLSDPDCAHANSASTRCGDGAADGALDEILRFGFEPVPGTEFDWCDGADLRGLSCTDLGFAGGTLGCRDDCNFDTSSCTSTVCGDGVVQGREVCEPSLSCIEMGFASGTPTCDACLNLTGCVE